jgi:hypothetical protein
MMSPLARVTVFLCFIYFPAISHAQIVTVTPCDLMSNPEPFDGKEVVVTALVSYGFENFSLGMPEGSTCKSVASIWVQPGGDVGTPAVFCCGSHEGTPGKNIKVNGVEVSLSHDEKYDSFMKRLTMSRPRSLSGGFCNDCNYYDVTATLRGRFFAAKLIHNVFYGDMYTGYGHMGCCSLFVIEQVEDYTAVRTKVDPPGDVDCSEHDHSWWDDKEHYLAAQARAADLGETWRFSDRKRVVEETLRDYQAEMHETKSGLLKIDGSDFIDDEKYGAMDSASWISSDGLSVYWITLNKPLWLKKETGKWIKSVWTVSQISHTECHAN